MEYSGHLDKLKKIHDYVKYKMYVLIIYTISQ